VRHPVERSWHNARNGITVEIPAHNELLRVVALLRDTAVNESGKAARPTRYLQCFKARQAGEHLVVHFSQPILGQKPVKRKLVTWRNEAHDETKRDCELGCAALQFAVAFYESINIIPRAS